LVQLSEWPTVFVAFLGLIWGTGNIVRIALSESHPRLGLFVGRDLAAWVLFLMLVLNPTILPIEIGKWLALVISVACAGYLYYMYFHRSKKKRVSKSQSLILEHRWENRVLFVLSCLIVITSVYTLYHVGYLSGNYDTIVTIISKYGGYSPDLPRLRSEIFWGMTSGIAGIVLCILSFAVVAVYGGVRKYPR
jgi:Ca2+/Na+ antiporter